MSKAMPFCLSRLAPLLVLLLAGCAGGGDAAPVAQLLTGTASNSSVIGTPRTIYARIASQAAKCWFGPFGSARHYYMTSADVPPPSSSAPVVFNVHRRLSETKRPWGPKLMQVRLTGSTSTTLDFTNFGLDIRTYGRVSEGMTGWANGRADCNSLVDLDRRWAPQRNAKDARANSKRR